MLSVPVLALFAVYLITRRAAVALGSDLRSCVAGVGSPLRARWSPRLGNHLVLPRRAVPSAQNGLAPAQRF